MTLVDIVSTGGDARHLVGNLIVCCRHFAVVIVTVTGYRVLLTEFVRRPASLSYCG